MAMILFFCEPHDQFNRRSVQCEASGVLFLVVYGERYFAATYNPSWCFTPPVGPRTAVPLRYMA